MVSVMVVGSVTTWGNEIMIYIFIFYLWCQGNARRWVLLLGTLFLQNSAESKERSVLTLGSPCLSCCVRNTAWSWLFLIFFPRSGIEPINLSRIQLHACALAHDWLLFLWFYIIFANFLRCNFFYQIGSQ